MSSVLLTARDVAVALKVSVRQVWKLNSEGRICPPLRVGRSVRWREADLSRFIAAGCDMRRFRTEEGEAQHGNH